MIGKSACCYLERGNITIPMYRGPGSEKFSVKHMYALFMFVGFKDEAKPNESGARLSERDEEHPSEVWRQTLQISGEESSHQLLQQVSTVLQS